MKKKVLVFLLVLMLPTEVFSLNISGRSAIMMDTESNRIMYEKDVNNKRLIASITKIMTFLIVVENSKLDEEVEVGEEVLTMYGSNIYLELNEKMSIKDLLYGLMLRSGNDAAIVLAAHVGGTVEKFIEMMNKKAESIGMKNTIFNNPHGLDEETKNYSTAYDMALLSSYISKNDLYKSITSTKKYTTNSSNKYYSWTNRNKMLFSSNLLTSGKTGYTPSAGHTFVSTAKKDDLELTVVTLNDGNMYNTAKKLYDYGFNNYKKYLILDKSNFKIDDAYYKDKISINNNFSYPLTEDEKDRIKVKVLINKLENYNNNDKVGEVTVELDNKELFREDIFVSTKKLDIFTKIWKWLFD